MFWGPSPEVVRKAKKKRIPAAELQNPANPRGWPRSLRTANTSVMRTEANPPKAKR